MNQAKNGRGPSRPDLGSVADEACRVLFGRLDIALPEFGWRRHGDHWTGTAWPSGFPMACNGQHPDRLMVYANATHWIKVHGHTGVRFLDYVNNGRKPVGPEFPAAVRRLCELAGVPFPEDAARDPEWSKRERLLEDRRRCLEIVVEHAQGVLWSEHGGVARAFLVKRGLSDEDMRELGLGFLHEANDPEKPGLLRRELEAAGADRSALGDAGVTGLAGYVTFPWLDAGGRVLTIYGRWPGSPPQGKPKTYALPGDATKGLPLYFDRARRAGHDELVLVEGVLDAAVLQVKGDTRVVASVAAQLNRNQVDALQKYRIKAVIVVGDSDGGGDLGTLANVKTLAAAGIATYVPARLPEGMDPDDFVNAHGLVGWKEHLKTSVTGIVFRARQELEAVSPESPEAEKRSAVERVAKLLHEVNGGWVEADREAVTELVVEKTGFKKRVLKKIFVPTSDENGERYFERDGGLVFDDGGTIHPLTNFTAMIVAQVVEDDGVETRRMYEIEATVEARTHKFLVSSEKFPALNWVTENLGSKAIVFAGPQVRDHARVAIQTLSPKPTERRVFTHLGWRHVDGEWFYLSASGAIGTRGRRDDVLVRLDGPLAKFSLPVPPEGSPLIDAVRESLSVLEVAPSRLSYPVLVSAYRAILGPCDQSVFLYGRTGVLKTALAALAQAHYGADLNDRSLVGFSSTANSIGETAFLGKDGLVVIDDFIPTGSTQDTARAHKDADRIFRSQGNGAGRGRMRSDGSLRSPRPPRGMLMGTGEDVPGGHSLRARIAIVEVRDGDVDLARLTFAQEQAAAGHFACALAGFVRWFASRYVEARERFSAEFAELRKAASQGSAEHRRTPATIAQLAIGLRYMLAFALDVGAIDRGRHDELWATGWTALGELGASQRVHHEAAEPAGRFVALLAAGLTAGRCHVADIRDGAAPSDPSRWGWRHFEALGRFDTAGTWRPEGDRVGWIEGDNLYLEAEAAFVAAKRISNESGESLAVSLGTLKRRLREKGVLLSFDDVREVLTVRRVVEGVRRHVLHLDARRIFSKPDHEKGESDQPDHDPTTTKPEASRVYTEMVGLVGLSGNERDTRICNSFSKEEPVSKVISPVCESPAPGKPDQPDHLSATAITNEPSGGRVAPKDPTTTRPRNAETRPREAVVQNGALFAGFVAEPGEPGDVG